MPAITRSLTTPDADHVKALRLDYLILAVDMQEWMLDFPKLSMQCSDKANAIRVVCEKRKLITKIYNNGTILPNYMFHLCSEIITSQAQLFVKHNTGHHLLARMSELGIPFAYPKIREELERHLIPELANLVFNNII